MRILVAEDDPGLRDVIVLGLADSGYHVDAVDRGDDAIDQLKFYEYDVAILDWRMPGREGIEVVEWARRNRRPTAILMLTARDTVTDRVTGLDAGADDYLVKPFSLGELAARLRALGRRGRAGEQADVLEAGPLQLDAGAREVRVDGNLVELTGTEFALLEYLMRNPGQVLSRDQLREEVWGAGFEPASNVVDIYVHYVRRKLTAAGMQKDPIRTVRGLGYAFRRPD